MRYFKCNLCGKIIEYVDETDRPTICCGREMEELIANITDGALEKHVPVVKIKDGLVCVKIGAEEHPMTKVHYIEWIAIETKHGSQRKELSCDDKPEAEFAITKDDEVVAVYAYCNLHGLWKFTI